MSQQYLHTHLTPAVLAAQRQAYGQQQAVPAAGGADHLGDREIAFIRARDSFYIASLTEAGAPYLQHRGGPTGFLRVLDPTTLAFPDFSGNRQLLSTGHLSHDPRVALFLMDYPARRRLKIDALAEVLPAAGEAPQVERVFRLRVVAFDWNCSQFITPRFTAAQVEEQLRPLRQRIAELEEALREAGRPAS